MNHTLLVPAHPVLKSAFLIVGGRLILQERLAQTSSISMAEDPKDSAYEAAFNPVSLGVLMSQIAHDGLSDAEPHSLLSHNHSFESSTASGRRGSISWSCQV